MATVQVVDTVVPEERLAAINDLLKDVPTVDRWELPLADGRRWIRLVLEASRVEPVVDALTERSHELPGFRVVVQPVAALLPPVEPPPPPSTARRYRDLLPWTRQISRQGREEIYQTVESGARLSVPFGVLVLLATVVVAVGLYGDNAVLIIAAMVIAPLVGPSLALSLATTLGDRHLAGRAAAATAVGFLLVLLPSFALGAMYPLGAQIPEVALRTQVGLGDVAVAVAVGVAGSFAYTTRLSALLVGVLVAVALLPPLATFGLLLGSGALGPATGALELTLVNLTGINLGATATFSLQGIRPRRWWKEDAARRSTVLAIVGWLGTLAALVVVLFVSTGTWDLSAHLVP